MICNIPHLQIACHHSRNDAPDLLRRLDEVLIGEMDVARRSAAPPVFRQFADQEITSAEGTIIPHGRER